MTEEQKRKISEAHKGKRFTEEHKRKLSEAHKGRKFTEEHKRKLSEAKKGKKNPAHSAYMKAHPVNYWKGKKRSEETIEKLRAVKGERNWHYGGTNSEETRKRISISRTVRKPHEVWKDEFHKRNRRKLEDGRIIMNARYVMQEHLGRELLFSEIVHHINGDQCDDRIENLTIVTRAEHIDLHRDALYAHRGE